MKALSIQQPWAWLIANGYKDIENRTWQTKFRGEFLIHAGKKFDLNGWRWVKQNFPNIPLPTVTFAVNKRKIYDYKMGGIIGKAHIVDCVSKSDSKWHENNRFGFVITKARPAEFIPYKGQLGLFNVPEEKTPTIWNFTNRELIIGRDTDIIKVSTRMGEA